MPGATPTGTKHCCQYEACLKNPTYGRKDAPASVCRDHRRAGMYCARDGKLWVATQDGKGAGLARDSALDGRSMTTHASKKQGPCLSSFSGTRPTGTTARKIKPSIPTQRPSNRDSNGSQASSCPSSPGLQSSSAETRLPRKATKDAQAVAATSSGGKRARAPSRKALEATGQVEVEGAQLMTRGKREEDMRQRAVQKEGRKAASAAGLKRGVILEEFTGVATGSPLDVIDGSTINTGASSSDTSKELWRKLSPAETLEEAQNLREAVTSTHHILNNGSTTESPERNIGAGNAEYRPNSSGHVKKSAKVRGSPTEKSKIQETPQGISERRHRGRPSNAYGGGEDCDVPICVFRDCTRPATFGVPGTVVRYCGFHRIFGMEEITDSNNTLASSSRTQAVSLGKPCGQVQ